MANVDQSPLVTVLQAEISPAGLLTLGLDVRLPHLQNWLFSGRHFLHGPILLGRELGLLGKAGVVKRNPRQQGWVPQNKYLTQNWIVWDNSRTQ